MSVAATPNCSVDREKERDRKESRQIIGKGGRKWGEGKKIWKEYGREKESKRKENNK
jgi:hypothetical protein